jgi:hypothetical protein
MKSTRIYKENYLKQIGFRPVLDICLVLFFAFSIVLQQSSSFSIARAVQKKEGKNLIALTAGRNAHNFNQPFQIPFEPGSKPGEQENDDEREPENDYHNDCVNPFLKTTYEYAFTATVCVHKIIAFTSAIEKRSNVSLIILHHSWKSFLV